MESRLYQQHIITQMHFQTWKKIENCPYFTPSLSIYEPIQAQSFVFTWFNLVQGLTFVACAKRIFFFLSLTSQAYHSLHQCTYQAISLLLLICVPSILFLLIAHILYHLYSTFSSILTVTHVMTFPNTSTDAPVHLWDIYIYIMLRLINPCIPFPGILLFLHSHMCRRFDLPL